MKEALAFIGVLVLAASLWFLQKQDDQKIIASKDQTIKSLQDSAQAKDDIIVKNNALVDSGNATIKLLQDTVQSKEDMIVKNNALIDSGNATIKSLQDTVQAKEDVIAKDTATISSYQEQINELGRKNENGGSENKNKDPDTIYPDDNGFDTQDMGSGFFAYQYFKKDITNPQNAPEPAPIPNHTPWTFSGNAGIAANNSGFYVSNATNRNANGATSTSGQVGFLSMKDSSISQMVVLPASTYTVTFDYEGRRNYSANQITVSIDGTVLFKGAPTDCNNFKQEITRPISLKTSGEHELKFCGLGGIDHSSGDISFADTFIDNISINRIGSRPLKPEMGGPDTNLDIIENVRRDGTVPVVPSNPEKKNILK